MRRLRRRSNAVVRNAGASHSTDSGGAEVVAGVDSAGGAGGRVVSQGSVDTGAGGGAEALAAEDALEGGEAEEDVLRLRRVPHGADPPDLSLERPERGADLDPEVPDEAAPN